MSTVALYLHTLRYLRPSQIAGRVWRRALSSPRPIFERAPPLRLHQGPMVGARCTRQPTLIGRRDVRLLNIERSCATAADWDRATRRSCWRYNLHYFDDLNAPGRCRTRWLGIGHCSRAGSRENPPGAGCGWDPYPTSRRIVNWIKWALADGSDACRLRCSRQPRRPGALARATGSSTICSAIICWPMPRRWRSPALFFDGAEAAGWAAHGRSADRIASCDEQVLADGGHFELQSDVSRRVLEDLLDLFNLRATYAEQPAARLLGLERPRSHAHVGWPAMTHPDGEIAFFNDAAFGHRGDAPASSSVTPRGLGIDVRTQRPRPPLVLACRLSGYVRASTRTGGTCICDCAAVGPDYLPAPRARRHVELRVDCRRPTAFW